MVYIYIKLTSRFALSRSPIFFFPTCLIGIEWPIRKQSSRRHGKCFWIYWVDLQHTKKRKKKWAFIDKAPLVVIRGLQWTSLWVLMCGWRIPTSHGLMERLRRLQIPMPPSSSLMATPPRLYVMLSVDVPSFIWIHGYMEFLSNCPSWRWIIFRRKKNIWMIA